MKGTLRIGAGLLLSVAYYVSLIWSLYLLVVLSGGAYSYEGRSAAEVTLIACLENVASSLAPGIFLGLSAHFVYKAGAVRAAILIALLPTLATTYPFHFFNGWQSFFYFSSKLLPALLAPVFSAWAEARLFQYLAPMEPA